MPNKSGYRAFDVFESFLAIMWLKLIALVVKQVQHAE